MQNAEPVQMVVSPSGRALLVAQSELTESDIELLYGSLIEGAFSAFCEDPQYVADMAEHGALLNYRRRLWAVRNEVSQECSDPDEVRARTQELMEERGIQPPKRTHRRARAIA